MEGLSTCPYPDGLSQACPVKPSYTQLHPVTPSHTHPCLRQWVSYHTCYQWVNYHTCYQWVNYHTCYIPPFSPSPPPSPHQSIITPAAPLPSPPLTSLVAWLATLLPPPPRLLAESCWSTDPLLRPSASTLVNKLKELLVAVEASVGSRRPQATADGLAALGMERGLRAF